MASWRFKRLDPTSKWWQHVADQAVSADKANKDSMHIEVTTIDHALTRPWTIVRPFEREHNPIWMTVDCSEDNHQLYIQNERYMLSGEGYLMPTEGPSAAGFKVFQAGEVRIVRFR